MVCSRVARRVAAAAQLRAQLGARAARRRAPAGSCRTARPPRRSVVENGGIEPGVLPPMSAWWPRRRRRTWPAGRSVRPSGRRPLAGLRPQPGVQIHRRDHRHVGQVRAAVVRVVEHVDVARRIAGLRSITVLIDSLIEPRCTGMCGALAISSPSASNSAQREVQPLLDVHRVGGVLQPQPHLLGDVHEQVVEDLEHHRVGVGADRVLRRRAAARACSSSGPAAVSRACQPGSTTVVALRSATIAGPSMRRAGRQRLAHVQAGVAPAAVGCACARARRAPAVWRARSALGRRRRRSARRRRSPRPTPPR